MQTLQAKPLETMYWDFIALSLVEKLLVYLKYQPTWDMVYKPSKNQHCTSRKPAKPAVKNFLQNIILLLEVWEQSFPVLVWRQDGFLLKNKFIALFKWLLSLTMNSSVLVAREVKDKFEAHHHANTQNCGVCIIICPISSLALFSTHYCPFK